MKFFLPFFSFLLLIGCSPVNNIQVMTGQHSHSFSTTLTKSISYNYLLYTPEDYNANKRYPLIIFLHGSGERGSNPNKLKVHSIPKKLDSDRNFPFIVVSPQCADGERWNAESLNLLLDEIVAKLPVDTNRIYLTGLSMGGFGVWKFAIAYPERFAAIAPVCGWGHLEDVEKLKNKPIWIFHGAKDDVVPPSESEKMYQFLQKYGNNNVRFTLYPDANHNAWDATYANNELYEWFLKHTK